MNSTIPPQRTGEHDAAPANRVSPDYAHLEQLLRGFLTRRGDMPSTGVQTAAAAHASKMAVVASLVTMQPRGWQEEVRNLVRPILLYPTPRVDLLTQACLAMGKVHLSYPANGQSEHQAYMYLQQARVYSDSLTGPLHNITLVVEIGTQLALAMRRVGADAEAHAQIDAVRSIIDAAGEIDNVTRQRIERFYTETLAHLTQS